MSTDGMARRILDRCGKMGREEDIEKTNP